MSKEKGLGTYLEGRLRGRLQGKLEDCLHGQGAHGVLIGYLSAHLHSQLYGHLAANLIGCVTEATLGYPSGIAELLPQWRTSLKSNRRSDALQRRSSWEQSPGV